MLIEILARFAGTPSAFLFAFNSFCNYFGLLSFHSIIAGQSSCGVTLSLRQRHC
jgi:hypothetical protein